MTCAAAAACADRCCRRLEKQLGWLPVIADFSRRLDIAGIVDRACLRPSQRPTRRPQTDPGRSGGDRRWRAIPIFHRAYDGNAAEIAQVVDTMHALQTLAAPRSFLMVGDSKPVSYTNVTAMSEAKVTFIAPLASARVPDALFANLDATRAEFVDYIPDRDENTLPWRRGTYRVTEDTMDLAGPRKSDPVRRLRRILVYSSANAAAQVCLATPSG